VALAHAFRRQGDGNGPVSVLPYTLHTGTPARMNARSGSGGSRLEPAQTARRQDRSVDAQCGVGGQRLQRGGHLQRERGALRRDGAPAWPRVEARCAAAPWRRPTAPAGSGCTGRPHGTAAARSAPCRSASGPAPARRWPCWPAGCPGCAPRLGRAGGARGVDQQQAGRSSASAGRFRSAGWRRSAPASVRACRWTGRSGPSQNAAGRLVEGLCVVVHQQLRRAVVQHRRPFGRASRWFSGTSTAPSRPARTAAAICAGWFSPARPRGRPVARPAP
jgi:hypothetical protein